MIHISPIIGGFTTSTGFDCGKTDANNFERCFPEHLTEPVI